MQRQSTSVRQLVHLSGQKYPCEDSVVAEAQFRTQSLVTIPRRACMLRNNDRLGEVQHRPGIEAEESPGTRSRITGQDA